MHYTKSMDGNKFLEKSLEMLPNLRKCEAYYQNYYLLLCVLSIYHNYVVSLLHFQLLVDAGSFLKWKTWLYTILKMVEPSKKCYSPYPGVCNKCQDRWNWVSHSVAISSYIQQLLTLQLRLGNTYLQAQDAISSWSPFTINFPFNGPSPLLTCRQKICWWMLLLSSKYTICP